MFFARHDMTYKLQHSTDKYYYPCFSCFLWTNHPVDFPLKFSHKNRLVTLVLFMYYVRGLYIQHSAYSMHRRFCFLFDTGSETHCVTIWELGDWLRGWTSFDTIDTVQSLLQNLSIYSLGFQSIQCKGIPCKVYLNLR